MRYAPIVRNRWRRLPATRLVARAGMGGGDSACSSGLVSIDMVLVAPLVSPHRIRYVLRFYPSGWRNLVPFLPGPLIVLAPWLSFDTPSVEDGDKAAAAAEPGPVPGSRLVGSPSRRRG